MQYLVKLICPPNGTVLDPFMGSGSTGKACMYEEFDFIGIEREEEYINIAKARIKYAEEHKDDVDKPKKTKQKPKEDDNDMEQPTLF